MVASGITRGLFQDLPEHPSLPAAKTTNRADTQYRHLWLCIYLPHLALETDGVANKMATGPIVAVDGEGSHCVVHVANKMAGQQGIGPGLGLNAAYALCPQLQVQSRDLDREQKQLEKLALWATGFTPWVHIEQSAALLLEVRGSLRLFAGSKNLCRRINSELDTRHHYRQLALAPTPLAALWLARAGQGTLITQSAQLPGQLGKLPLHSLGWADKTIASLRGMGVYNVRDCLRLPRDGFARRFGKRHLAELDRALGRLPDPRPSFVPPQQFSKAIEMPAETTATDQLMQAAEKLLTEMSQYLIARQAGVQNIALKLFHADSGAEHQAPTTVQVGLLEHGQESLRLLSLLRLKLESLTLAAPVIGLELCSGKVTTLVSRERNLFSSRPGNSVDWPGLLENLRTKLGVSAVYGVAGVADHRPELAWCRVEPQKQPAGHSIDSGGNRNRPLWLLAQPQRLTTIAGRPDYDGPLTRISGPERIETGWWDGVDIARDYYVASDSVGLRLWIYRERRDPRDWYLHGYFS